jgi:hypothetical protein
MYPLKVSKILNVATPSLFSVIFDEFRSRARHVGVLGVKMSKIPLINFFFFKKKKKKKIWGGRSHPIGHLGVAGHPHLAKWGWPATPKPFGGGFGHPPIWPMGVVRPPPFGPWGWLATPIPAHGGGSATPKGQNGGGRPPPNGQWGGYGHPKFFFFFFFFFFFPNLLFFLKKIYILGKDQNVLNSVSEDG